MNHLTLMIVLGSILPFGCRSSSIDSGSASKPSVTRVNAVEMVEPLQQERLEIQEKVKIRDLGGLPDRTYVVDVSATELMDSDASFDVLASRLRRDVQADLLAYEIEDGEANRQFLGVLMNIAMLQGRTADARRLIEQIRSTQPSPRDAMMTGLVMESVLDAREMAGAGNAASDRIFQESLRRRLGALPWEIVGDEVLKRRNGSSQIDEAVFRGIITSGLDPMLADSGGEISYEVARQLVTFRSILLLQIPLVERTNEVYSEFALANGADLDE
ncbi:MAG: hypothetical protein CMJ24_04140 [Phycisphaerae bacterium]|nr:hypothetical protein [Phycisphaerae bacterium]